MLTAYTYYEPEEQKRIQKEYRRKELFEKEVSIAKEYLQRQKDVGKEVDACPVCKHRHVDSFFCKWDITYYRCHNCYSIFAGIGRKEAHEYETSMELLEFYNSDEYQKQGEKARDTRWNEIVDWISFRAFRYNSYKNKLQIVDVGNRWKLFREKIKESNICGSYSSIYSLDEKKETEYADIVLSFDFIQRKVRPSVFFADVSSILKPNGLLFLGLKSGSGMDVLLLRDKNPSIFPPEHVFMPSKEGIYLLLEKAGFEVLEYTTPGMFDVNFVKEHLDDLPEDDFFMDYLMRKNNATIDADLQRFIQKAGMSSYAQIVARKKE